MALYNALYKIEILDSTLTPVGMIQAFVPLSHGGWLEYTSVLSGVGICRFRVMTKDPIFKTLGDILQPFQYHVRVTRGQFVVWQGMITKNPHREKKFIEVEAKTYLYLLDKILVRHDAADNNGAENYRNFTTGTMAQAIQTVLTEPSFFVAASNGATIANATLALSGSALRNLKIGVIENPLFPNYFIDSNSKPVGGQQWNFGTPGLSLKFDYQTVLYVLKSFGMYSNSDFELTPDLTFNFKKLIGNVNNGIYFNYSAHGNIENYDVVLNGERMVNYLVGLGADNNYKFIQDAVAQNDSIQKYGMLMGIAAFSDVKNLNTLRSRLNEQLRLVSKPDTELVFTLNQRAYPLGQYGLGDAVRVRIVNNIVNFDQQRRIVQIEVLVTGTGKETIKLTTNYPRPEQLV